MSASPRTLPDLGPDFAVEIGQRAWFAVRAADAADLAATGYGAESDGALRRSSLSGRKPLHELVTRRGTLVVRRFSHGGLLRFATGRRFADPTRPFVEIACARHLEAAGIATATVVAARARRAALVGWELDLVTRRVEDAVDLGHVLGAVRRGEIDRRVVPLVAAAAGACVRRLHAAGFLHADLTPNNLLVSRAWLAAAERRMTRRAGQRGSAADALALPELVVLDLDRARIVERPSDDARRRNLRRLWRFVTRRDERDGRAVAPTDVARFFKAYDPGGTAWRDDWRAVARAHTRARAFHGLGWLLERLFGRGRDVRETRRV